MPLSPLGIFHTIVGIIVVVSAIYLLWQDKQILLQRTLGKVYLLGTLLTAASALGIYKHGSANAAHILAALTIAAVVAGYIAATTNFLGGVKKYFVALCFSATILFHLIPTATEILTRFPMDAPMVSSLQDPLLLRTFLVILIVFTILLALQMNWLRKQP
jgi:uncharacterized membrane protein